MKALVGWNTVYQVSALINWIVFFTRSVSDLIVCDCIITDCIVSDCIVRNSKKRHIFRMVWRRWLTKLILWPRIYDFVVKNQQITKMFGFRSFKEQKLDFHISLPRDEYLCSQRPFKLRIIYILDNNILNQWWCVKSKQFSFQ